MPSSCLDWLELASSGTLYEHFGQDRERVKQEFIFLLFGKRPLNSFSIGQQIEADFPEVAEVVTAMKTKNCLVGRDERPYRYVACMLQLYESTLMIYRVCGRIMKERPDTPVWTIHDCIMTTKPHTEYVKHVVREEFGGVGLLPSIKEEAICR